MRKLIPLLLLCLAFGFSCKPKVATAEEASRYNNQIVNHGDTVLKAFDAFNLAVESRDSVHAAKRLELAILSADRAVDAISKMPPLDNDSTLKEAALVLMQHYAMSFRKDFQASLPLMLADSLDVNSIEHLDSIVTVFTFVEDSLRFLMFSAQSNLSAKYGLQMR